MEKIMKANIIKRSLLALAGTAVLATAMPAVAQTDPFVGSIHLVGFNFPPRGFADADGQILSIASNSTLFSLFGTMYGGDGRSTFALPDMRGRSAIHAGTGSGLPTYTQGQRGGTETQTLGINNMPSHSHGVAIQATAAEGDTDDPIGTVWAKVDRTDLYSTSAPDVSMAAGTITEQAVGNGQSFSIRDPYIVLRYVVALVGTFPSRN
jgi:microcystin-dependent protein